MIAIEPQHIEEDPYVDLLEHFLLAVAVMVTMDRQLRERVPVPTGRHFFPCNERGHRLRTILRDESSLGVVFDMNAIVFVVVEVDVTIQSSLILLKHVALCVWMFRYQPSGRRTDKSS